MLKTLLSKNNINHIPSDTTVYVGMSGGVDSSVVAHLLTVKKCKVIGVYIDCWDIDTKGCTAEQDRLDALKVATKLGIKFLTWDFKKEYKEKVLSYFLNSYKKGETPNPDIFCNTFIKFGVFIDKVLSLDPNAYIATGHYAQNFIWSKYPDKHFLGKATDLKKDQSYFLYDIDRAVLPRVIFPLGGYLKNEVREYANKHGLLVSNKPDSQGVCFTGGLNVKKYLVEKLGYKRGVVVDIKGNNLGYHNGVHLYTLGERFVGNLDLDINGYDRKKLYVVNKSINSNVLTIGIKQIIYSNSLLVKISFGLKLMIMLARNGELFIQTRNTGALNRCKGVNIVSNSLVEFKTEIKISTVPTGQSVVCYTSINGKWLIVSGGIARST